MEGGTSELTVIVPFQLPISLVSVSDNGGSVLQEIITEHKTAEKIRLVAFFIPYFYIQYTIFC